MPRTLTHLDHRGEASMVDVSSKPAVRREALAAGRIVMKVYEADGAHRAKSDGSPVTDADEQAEALILAALAKQFPDVPVIAEESVARGQVPAVARRFFLVDPLDGTREFVNRNGEFTVNIALIEDGGPVAGAVYAPALGQLYFGGARAWGTDIATGSTGPIDGVAIHARPQPDRLVAVASRSHGDADTERFLATLPIAERRGIGSSLKFCLVAAGEADVYPRFGPTMEWDTAAGHAVLAAAGGRLVGADGAAFAYGKAATGFRNGGFVAWGK